MEPWPRPFDPNMLYLGKTATGVHVPNDPFGGRNMYTSPINDVTPVEEQQTMLVRDREDKKAVKDGLLGTKDIKVRSLIVGNDFIDGRYLIVDLHYVTCFPCVLS